MDEEIALPQGGTVKGVVRVGDTVRRAPGPRAEYVRRVLKLLETQAVLAPRFLGVDEKGRDILSFIAGEATHGRSEWSDAQLVHVARLVRALHDATAGSALAEGSDVICHTDLAPWNLILDAETPVAFIDFDGATPGARVDDLGYLLWTFLGLGNALEPSFQARRIALVCRAYGLALSHGVIDAIIEQQLRIEAFRKSLAQNDALAEDAQKFNAARAAMIGADIAWVRKHRAALAAAL